MGDDLVGPAPKQDEPVLLVEAALGGGWRAVKARWALLLTGSVFLLILAGAAELLTFWPVASAVSGSATGANASGTAGVDLMLLMSSLLLALAAIALAVGYVETALRVSRGDQVGFGDLGAGFRRLPAVLVCAAVTFVICMVGALTSVVAALALSTAVRQVVFTPVMTGLTNVSLITIVLSAIAAVILGAGGAAYLYVLTGISQWPLLVMDQGLDGIAAMKASWAMMRGHRLTFVSFGLAAVALWPVGLVLFGVGVVLTTSIGLAAYAALYDRVRQGGTVAVPAGPRGGLSSWTADWFLVSYLAAITWILVLVATVAPILEATKANWPPYGNRAVLAPIFLPPIVVLVAYGLLSLRRGRPGRLVVGPGWGRFEWLAVVTFLVLLVPWWNVASLLPRTYDGITALGVGEELGRVVTQDLPAGYDRRLESSGTASWFDRMRVANDDDTDTVMASYTITDTARLPYYFELVQYNDEASAREAYVRMRGSAAKPAPVLGANGARADETAAAFARFVVLDGNTVLAGEASATRTAELERLMKRQLDRLQMARDSVEPVYRGLPKPQQRLAPLPTAGS